ncbi:MAG: hypothetical protein U0359_33200 [Byssovorax sp.]
MTSSMLNRPIAVLPLPKQNYALITFATAVHDAMAKNPNFPAPVPPLADFKDDIDALADAETKAAMKTKGAAAARDAKKKRVLVGLWHERDYVQSIADDEPDPADAAAVIKSAFMEVRKPPVWNKSDLEARDGEVSGSVLLVAKAIGPRTTYFWQYSLDQQAWTNAGETLRAKTTLTGLPAGHLCWFRFRALMPNGPVDYSQPVSLLVR